MHDHHLLPHETIEEKVEYYYAFFLEKGRDYSKDKLREAIEYLSYKGAPAKLPKTESLTEPTIYIFRHGQTRDNADFVFSGWRDANLTEKGREQAKVLAEKLKDKRLDMLISSTQVRAIETMKIAVSLNPEARGLEIHQDPRIKERCYGDYQGQSKLEMYMQNAEGLEKIRRSFETVPPNGESLKMVCKRVAEFCTEIVPLMKTHKINVAVSCHGNSIRGFRRYFEGLSDEETATIETPLGQDYEAYVV